MDKMNYHRLDRVNSYVVDKVCSAPRPSPGGERGLGPSRTSKGQIFFYISLF